MLLDEIAAALLPRPQALTLLPGPGPAVPPDDAAGLRRLSRPHPAPRLPQLGDPRARQAVDLLLIALAKAEIEADRTSTDGGPSKADFYEYEREQKWSPFLGTALKILDHMEDSGEEEEEEEEDEDRVAG